MSLRLLSHKAEWDPRFEGMYRRALVERGASTSFAYAQARHGVHYLRLAAHYDSHEVDHPAVREMAQITFAASKVSSLLPNNAYALDDLLTPGWLPQDAGMDENLAEALLTMAHALQGVVIDQRVREGKEWLEAGLIASKYLGYLKLERLFVSMLGIWFKTFSQSEQALSCYERAFKAANATRDTIAVAAIQNDIGALYLSMGKPEQALTHLTQAQKAFERTEHSDGFVAVLNNMIIGLIDLKRYDDAIKLAERVKESQTDDTNLIAVADALQRLGLICSETNRHDLALTYLNRALEIFRKASLPDEVADTLSIMSSVHWSMNNVETARTYLQQALQIYTELKNIPFMVALMDNYAILLYEEQAPETAIGLLQKAVFLAEQHNLVVDGRHESISGLRERLSEWEAVVSEDLFWDLVLLDDLREKFAFIEDHPLFLTTTTQRVIENVLAEAKEESDHELFEDLVLHRELLDRVREEGLENVRRSMEILR